ncbi:radical SAM/SPASM domain-containing protein [Chloroflexota bacterium]
MAAQKLKHRSEETDKRDLLKERKPLVYEKTAKFTEKMKRGESIAIIQFQYNYACNFRCVHCSVKRFQGKKKARQFTMADVRELSRQADELGLARFVITGGEPLIFPDFDELVEAIDPQKFYINVDTNGWFLDEERAKHLKSLGIDRVQLSIDGLDAKEHDSFRKAKGSHERCMRAIEATLKAGLDIFIQTVVTKQRLYSDEFMKFVEYFSKMGIGVFVTYAKPVGAWEGNLDVMVSMDDINYFRELEKKHNIFTHLTPGYGLNMGCIAVKGMISVTQYGDVLPCPYMHLSIGNVFEEPLKDIIQRGLGIKYFGEYVDTCTIAEDKNFINNYVAKKIYGKPVPVPCAEVFTDKDKTQKPFYKYEHLFRPS